MLLMMEANLIKIGDTEDNFIFLFDNFNYAFSDDLF